MPVHLFYLALYLLTIVTCYFFILKERKKWKKVNKDLKESNQELLQKTFRISLFNDSIKNIKTDLSEIINDNKSISPNKLFRIENLLETLILEKGIWKEYKVQFGKNYPDFSKRLHKRNPKLSINDYKHATFVRLNMSVKEVANLTRMNPRTIEIARYRLKKRLNLTREIALRDYLQAI